MKFYFKNAVINMFHCQSSRIAQNAVSFGNIFSQTIANLRILKKTNNMTPGHFVRLIRLNDYSGLMYFGPWSNGRKWPGLKNHVFFYVRVHVCHLQYPRKRWTHYEKKDSRHGRCDALSNILLGNLLSWHSCGCFFFGHVPPS